MGRTLRVTVGQHSLAGGHERNQDFHGARVPAGHLRIGKGIALALADGISSSRVSHLASATAVRGFLDDYFATAEAWSVRRAGECVLNASNAWLHAQTQRGDGRFDKDRGLVCTFSALILKGRELHLFHVGDTRVYRVHRQALEQLSEDHRLWLSAGESYLARALGCSAHVDIDYRCWPAEVGEIYLLASDGAYSCLDAASIGQALAVHGDDLDAAAARLVDEARRRGSDDDATVQLLRIDELPDELTPQALLQRDASLLLPQLSPRVPFEGFSVIRELQLTARSHLHLAIDNESGMRVVLKTPSVDLREQADYLDGFVLEEWVARRIDNPHVVRAWPGQRPRRHLFVALEYIEGQTLAQWMRDHPAPPLDVVRKLVSQIASGVQALHHREMIHRDLRPENIMIDPHGTVRLIDLASVQVAGLREGFLPALPETPPGSLQYMAPECLLGEPANAGSDLFSLAAITYQMLSGNLPYGLQGARLRQPGQLRELRYQSLRPRRPELPVWLDGVLARALQPNPAKRQEALSEFIHDLKSGSGGKPEQRFTPLLERDPLLFWKSLSATLLLVIAGLLLKLSRVL